MNISELEAVLSNATLSNTTNYIPKPRFNLGYVIKVYDGDSCTVAAMMEDGVMCRLSIRVLGVDTPELRSSCIHEKKCAVIARGITSSFCMGRIVNLDITGMDKYGRCLSDITVDNRSLSKHLLDLDIAVPYYGKKKETRDFEALLKNFNDIV